MGTRGMRWVQGGYKVGMRGMRWYERYEVGMRGIRWIQRVQGFTRLV